MKVRLVGRTPQLRWFAEGGQEKARRLRRELHHKSRSFRRALHLSAGCGRWRNKDGRVTVGQNGRRHPTGIDRATARGGWAPYTLDADGVYRSRSQARQSGRAHPTEVDTRDGAWVGGSRITRGAGGVFQPQHGRRGRGCSALPSEQGG